MEKLHFKTNINCGGCVAKVTPKLNETEGICHWSVDTIIPLTLKAFCCFNRECVIENINAPLPDYRLLFNCLKLLP
jgi:hypothetical protein